MFRSIGAWLQFKSVKLDASADNALSLPETGVISHFSEIRGIGHFRAIAPIMPASDKGLRSLNPEPDGLHAGNNHKLSSFFSF
jgi:hypothetical protein